MLFLVSSGSHFCARLPESLNHSALDPPGDRMSSWLQKHPPRSQEGLTCVVCSPLSGHALGFAVQYITSEVHGARLGASKAVVILIMGTSTDSVATAAKAARSNRKCPVFSVHLETVLNCLRIKSGKVLFLGIAADFNVPYLPEARFQTGGTHPINPCAIWKPSSNV